VQDEMSLVRQVQSCRYGSASCSMAVRPRMD